MKRPLTLVPTVCLLLATITFLSCEDSDDPSYDIYVFGMQNQKGTVWMNGTERPETINSNFLAGSFVNGKDFYVCGFGTGGIPPKSVAKYWKNGIEVALSNGVNDERANDVAVVGSDVYAVGFDQNVNESFIRAKFWKNGNEVLLGANTAGHTSLAMEVQVSGSDVYILGVENVNNNDSIVSRLWKNGKRVSLEHDSVYYEVTSMAIKGSDVYLIGHEGNRQGFRSTVYWKNGMKVARPFSGYDNIVFRGNDVYSTGMDGNQTGYWKNDKFVPLTDQWVDIVSLDVIGNDVIVAGNLLEASGVYRGIVWKNAVPVAPFLGNDAAIRIAGAAVVPR
ncbi:MAG TPA: hypothetical protein VGD40_05325 [Chryseosolibacter sp.]